MAKQSIYEWYESIKGANLGIDYRPYSTDDGPRGVGITTYKPPEKPKAWELTQTLTQDMKAPARAQRVGIYTGDDLLKKGLDAASEKPRMTERVGKTLLAGVKGSTASNANAATMAYEATQGARTSRNEELMDQYWNELTQYSRELANMQTANQRKPGSFSQAEIEIQEDIIRQAQTKYNAMRDVVKGNVQQGATQASYQSVDELQASSARDTQRAKQGLGKVGQALVDVGVSGTQMAMDAATNSLLGTPGSLAPLVTRSFGSGAQQARQEGAGLGEQALYGGAIAAKEVLTEKLFNVALPFSKAYGGGSMDDMLQTAISKTVDKLATTDAGRRVLNSALNIGASGATEGLEELIGTWAEWQLPRIYGGDVATAQQTVQDSFYSFLVGSLSGIGGGAIGEVATGARGSNEILRSAQDDTRKPASVAEMAADMLDAPKAQQTEQAAPYAPENPTVAEIAAGYEPAAAAQQELDTTIDADPTTHTPEQMQSIREYQRATDSGLLRFIDKVKSLTDKSYQAKIKYSLGDTSARQAADVKKNTGVNADGFTNKISGTSVIHIINRHGENGEADSSMAKPQDIARVGYVLNHYDSAKLLTDENGKQVFSTEWTNSDGSPAQMMEFSKKIDGTYYVIEAAPDSKRKNLMVVSAYIQKNNGNAAHTLNMEGSSPQLTSKTPYESRASVKTSVPQSGGAVKAEDSVGAAKSGFDQYSHAQLEYGTIPEGENPARTVDVPQQMDDGSYVGRGTRTIMEAGATSDLLLPELEQGVVQGLFSHKVQKNNDITAKAEAWVAQAGGGSVETAFNQWYRETGRHEGMSNDRFAQGMVVYTQLNRAATQAAQRGDAETRDRLAQQAVQTAVVLEGNAHTVAQQLQMMRMIKKMSPEMQQFALQKTVQELNARLVEQGKGAVDMNDPELSAYSEQWVEAMRAGNEDAAQTAKDALYRAIAAKVPKTFGECFNAWRYLAMLGNPKTIVRNTLGNVAMMPMTGAKNVIGAGLEKVAVKKEDRTKVAIPLRTSERGQKLLAFAKEDFDTVRQTALGENKNASSNTGSELQKAIREAHSKFNAKGVKQWQQATDWAMNNELFGDVGFLKRHYQHALAQAAMARGYTAQQLQDGKIDEAAMDKLRAYAVKQAQEATFRDTNSLTKLVKKLDFTPTTAAGKAAKFAIEGTLPFKSTPANVLARGVEYGPGGVLRALSTDLHKVATGKISAADYVENLSKGLAGTAVLGLGYMLAANGLLTGGEIDDDDEREGHQAYALELNGKSYTLDWLSPVAIPLFMGVELQRMTQDDGQDAFGAFVDASSNLMAPLLELSCMSGMKDMLDQIAYGTDGADLGNMVYAFFAQPFLSYVGQALPTLLSQLATTMETERGYTYVGDINNSFGKNVVRSAARITEKIPRVDWRQQPYVDEFGRKETYDTSFGGYAARAVENFVSPGYLSDIEQTDTDQLIGKVEEASGEEVSPTRRGYTIDLGDETVRLTGDQHTQYQTTYGETVTALYDAAERSAGFRLLSPEEQAAVLDTAQEYANAVGKAAVTEYEPDAAWMRNLMAQDAPAEDVAQYVINKQVGSAFSDAMELAETDAAAGAAEIDRIFNAYEGLDEAQQTQLLEQVGGQLESYVAMRRAGLDAAQYVQVRGAYDAIEAQEDAGAVQKATEFAKWLDESGLNGRQKRVAKEQMKYWQIFPAEAERYETLTGAGLSADKSKAVYDAMAAREADTNAKKYDAINAAQGLSNEDKYLAARALLAGDDDTANARIDAAMMAGIDYGTWTEYYNAKEYYKEELGISVSSKAEYTELINGLGIEDRKTKQALWVIANLNHKPWTCPYGSSELSRELYYYLQEHKTVSEYE